MPPLTCTSCGTPLKAGGWSQGALVSGPVEIDGKPYCASCAKKSAEATIAGVLISTTPSLDGYRVKAYLGVESVEVVLGTGPFSEFDADFADFFGTRATEFEKKLQRAKHATLDKLRLVAARQGANAVIGVDLDYTEFTGNRIGVIASGTLVHVVPAQE
jgi:uncharacterized protein YbjQ (UPF0145 family)